jgi:hypothetical protein
MLTVVRAGPDSQICQGEVFGLVVTVSTFRTEIGVDQRGRRPSGLVRPAILR